MSARPEWMPEISTIRCMAEGVCSTPATISLLRDTGLRAQIAILAEEDDHMVEFLGDNWTDENREWRQAKLAALRKELAGGTRKNQFTEITPAEAQKRYLKSMKEKP